LHSKTSASIFETGDLPPIHVPAAMRVSDASPCRPGCLQALARVGHQESA
jgi:hypothetical protein